MQAFIAKIAACLVAAATAGHAAPTTTTNVQGAQLVAPMVAQTIVGMDMEQPILNARQVVLEGLLSNAQQQVAANPQAVAQQPTLGALVNAYAAHAQLVAANTAAGAAPAAAAAASTETQAAAEALLASVVTHYATAPDAHQQVQQLRQSNAAFAAAADAAAARREEECDMVSNIYRGQYGKISEATKACLCDDSGASDYVVCRAMMAADLNTQTIQTMQSTATDKRMQRVAMGHPAGMNVTMADPSQSMVNNTWQPKYMEQQAQLSTPSLLQPQQSRRQAEQEPKGPTAFDPTSGEFSATACVGEVVEVCVKGELAVPIFETVKSAAGDYVVNQVTKGQTSSSSSLADFLANNAKGLAEDSKLELDISLCLGLPGLTEVLNEVGISLCIDLLRADLFFLQGPTGQLTTGLDLLIVNLSAWYKYKFANGSPVCPQDFSMDIMNQMCPNPDLYQTVIDNFVDEDFCNLQGGQGIFGATITLDLFFWSRQWTFAETPEPRDAPVCVDGKPENPGTEGLFASKVCPAAAKAYLAANGDVLAAAQDSCGGQAPDSDCVLAFARQHWLTNGRNEYRHGNAARAWPGQECIDQTLLCWEAQQQFWQDNMDVADSDVYGPDVYDPSMPGMYTYLGQESHNLTISRRGAWDYFQANKASNTSLLWRGDLCSKADINYSRRVWDPNAWQLASDIDAKVYVQRYPDLKFVPERWNNMHKADGSIDITNVMKDWVIMGAAEGRYWGNATTICWYNPNMCE